MRATVPCQSPSCAVRNGFSLVEMMVVLLVMGLLATAAVLTIPGDGRKLRDEAERVHVVGASRSARSRQPLLGDGEPSDLCRSQGAHDADYRILLWVRIAALLADLAKMKPASSKGVYVQKVTVSSTMGPGVPVDRSTLGL